MHMSWEGSRLLSVPTFAGGPTSVRETRQEFLEILLCPRQPVRVATRTERGGGNSASPPFLFLLEFQNRMSVHAPFLIHSVFDAGKRALSLNKNKIEVLWWVYVVSSVTTSSESALFPSGSKRVAVSPSLFHTKLCLPQYRFHFDGLPFSKESSPGPVWM